MSIATGTRRRYTKREKGQAVVAALASTPSAAAASTGIPVNTIRYWLDDPRFADLRSKTQEDLAVEMRALAHLLVRKVVERIDELEAKDLLIGFGIATDKAQLLSGGATSRTETITDGLTDHEKQQLRDGLERLLGNPAEALVGADAGGAGTEVRQ